MGAIRLKAIRLKNFKNVIDSKIEFENDELKLVTALYGPNGSGKSAVIEAIEIFKLLSSKEPLRLPFYFIKADEDITTLEYIFSYNEYKVKYFVVFKANVGAKATTLIKEKLLIYTQDKLRYSFRIDRNKGSFKDAIGVTVDGKKIGLKYFDYEKLISRLSVAKSVSKSFIFDGLEEAIKDPKLYEFMYQILESFNNYGDSIKVISNNSLYGNASQNEICLELVSPELKINLLEGTLVPLKAMPSLELAINSINKLLVSILDMTIGINSSFGLTLNEEGEEAMVVTFDSVRNESVIPLAYEAYGAKRIISIASSIITAFNDRNVLVLIDDLDRGIFEILLGELVKVLAEREKGQLIFTAHNLRVLEVLDNSSILMATMNGKNKFVRFSNLKPTSNFRDMYLRVLALDSDSKYYKKIDSMEVSLALRDARKDRNYG